jgi:hypothetical protein
MDNSTVSTLSPPPADLLDIDDVYMDDMDDQSTPSSAYGAAAAPVPFSLSSRRHQRPLTAAPGFIGYSFKRDGNQYTIREKSATQKGGKPSYIWKYGSELSTPKLRFLSWLCNSYWDQGRIVILLASNTIRLARHLLEKHQISGKKRAATVEEEEEEEVAA